MSEKPLILAFVKDLNFIFRIESVAEDLGYKIRFIETADQIAPEEADRPGEQIAEHLIGRGAILLDVVTDWQPALIIFDLLNESIPWYEWINLIASVPATRRIPILCYGAHVDVENMKKARKAGAIAVVARSRFVTELPHLLKKYTKFIDLNKLEQDCQIPLSPSAIQGIKEFNRGNYIAARKSLTNAWMEDMSTSRDLYRAVLEVSAAYNHILCGNFKGAAKMFLRLRQWINPLPENCKGINVVQLRQNVYAVHQHLLDLGPERLVEFNKNLLLPIEFADEH